MQKISRTFVLFVALSATSLGVMANKYSDAITSFSNAGKSGEYFKTAYGYAIFPTIGKGGLVVGGAHGKGLVFVNAQQVGSVVMTQLTAGWQVGAQAYSQIIFFEHEQAFKNFISGNFEFSAQATAVALTAGVSAEANTGGGMGAGISGGRNDANTVHAGYRKGMAMFTIAKGGLMGEAVIGGQKFVYTPLPPAPARASDSELEPTQQLMYDEPAPAPGPMYEPADL